MKYQPRQEFSECVTKLAVMFLEVHGGIEEEKRT